jgi:hypothetical protein
VNPRDREGFRGLARQGKEGPDHPGTAGEVFEGKDMVKKIESRIQESESRIITY